MAPSLFPPWPLKWILYGDYKPILLAIIYCFTDVIQLWQAEQRQSVEAMT